VFFVTMLSNYSIVERINFDGMIKTGQNRHGRKEYRPGVDVFTTHSTGTSIWLNTAQCPVSRCGLGEKVFSDLQERSGVRAS